MTGNTKDFELNRRSLLKTVAGVAGAAGMAAIVPGIAPAPVGAQDDAWASEPDMARAAEQAKDFQTYGMPDDWANYGEVYTAFFAHIGAADGKHTDTDMSSLEEITKFDAEKDKPVAAVADIGLLWGKVAEEKGVTPSYLPPTAADLPDGYKGASGGWVATFAGVPALVVNVDALEKLGVAVPATWADLTKPEYKGLIGSPGDPRTSGTAQTTFLAWTYAAGGDATNLQPGVDFAKEILPNYYTSDASVDLLEKGEIAIWMRYDFNCFGAVKALKEKNVNAEVVIPGVSIYAPSALMLNKYNTEKADLIKAFSEFVLGDEAAMAFAKFGARPIRYVLGKQELPEEAKATWLPDEHYKDVVVIEDFTGIDAQAIATTWDEEVLGG